MRILVTGAAGFVGSNLVATLENLRSGKDRTRPTLVIDEVWGFDRDTDPAQLKVWCEQADAVVHLAGVNRPQNEQEFVSGNVDLTAQVLAYLRQREVPCPVLLASSIQAERDNPYGRSKRAAEELVLAYGEQSGAAVWVYRLPNLFGKWCRPFYNSVVATFCHQLARNEAITVNDRAAVLTLAYIDDVLDEWLSVLAALPPSGERCVPTTFTVTLGELADRLTACAAQRTSGEVPRMDDALTVRLYATFLSYLPLEACVYDLEAHSDVRGSFAEFLRTPERGQVSINVTKPGQVKGNHWHHTKHEKFLVVAGDGVIRLRCARPDGDPTVMTYRVSGQKLQVVDIPTGYTHNIENIGTEDLVTVMWASECFDPARPDTFYLEVEPSCGD